MKDQETNKEPMKRDKEKSLCEVCGEELTDVDGKMFRYHGYARPCPKPPLEQEAQTDKETKGLTALQFFANWLALGKKNRDETFTVSSTKTAFIIRRNNDNEKR